MGYTPLGLIFRGDRGPGTVGTTRGKRHDTKHIGLQCRHTSRVHHWGGQGTGDTGPGTGGTTIANKQDIKHIGLDGIHIGP